MNASPRLATHCLLLLLLAAPAGAQDGAAAGDGAASEPGLEERFARAETERTALQRRLDDGLGALSAPMEQALRGRVERLEQLEFTLTQLGLERQRREEAEQAARTVAEARSALSASAGGGVIALPEVDALADRLKAQSARARAVGRAAEAAAASLEQARIQLARAERERSQARALLDGEGDGPNAALLAERLETARVTVRLRSAEVELRAAERRALDAEHELQQARERLLEEELALTRGRTVFTPEQLAQRLAALDEQAAAIEQRLQLTSERLPGAERAWTQARQAREDGEPGSALLLERELAARASLEQLRRELRALAEQRARLELRRTAWERRQTIVTGGAAAGARTAWLDETRRHLDELDGQEAMAEAGLDELRRRRAEAEARIAELEAAAAASRRTLSAGRDRRRALDELVRVTEEELQDVGLTAALLENLVEDLQRASDAGAWLDGTWERVRGATASAWTFEITTVDERQVTVGGLVKGLLLLLIGLVIVRFAWSWLGDLLERRFRLEKSAAATLEAIAFYVTAVVVAIIALQVANVPLTAFTLLGGAFAIGVGFGMQNLMGNFISGLILLLERPVRVGDLVEVRGGTKGIIRGIGARSTKVRTGEGVDILVPNSMLLENEVVNWTLSDDAIRTCVTVGVAYGSPTREVQRLLRTAAENHGLVLPHPGPFVLFGDFGDNSLAFELHCWVRVRKPMDARRIESDLRFMIDHRFREAGITIAFPQRDVHLDLTGPLAVRMHPDDEEPGESA